jgi:hypothetical protein
VEMIRKTQASRDQAPVAMVGKVSRYIKKQVKKQSRLTEGKGRRFSKARNIASDDFRNAFVAAASNEVLCRDLDPQLIFNTDATTFQINTDEAEVCNVIIVKSDDGNDVRYTEDASLPVYIKLQLVIGANGWTPPLVWVVGCKALSETALVVKEVKGLTHDSSPGAFGYVLFTKSRAGNPASCEWVFNFVHRCIVEAKTAYLKSKAVADSGIALSSVFPVFFLDGEMQQLKTFTESAALLKKFDDANILVSKHNAAKTHVEQAADRGQIFRGSKALVKSFTFSEYSNPALEVEISNAMSDERLKFASTYAKKINSGLQKATAAVIRVITTKNAIGGFTKAGIITPPGSDWEQIARYIPFNDLTTPLEKDEFDQMMEVYDEAMEEYRTEACISDAAMDKWGIPRSLAVGPVDKEARPLCQRRCTVLNAEKTLTRLRADKDAKLAADEEIKARQRAALELKNAQTTITGDYEEAKTIEAKAQKLTAVTGSGLPPSNPPNPNSYDRSSCEKVIAANRKSISSNRIRINKARTTGDLNDAKTALDLAKVSFDELPALLLLASSLPNIPGLAPKSEELIDIEAEIKRLRAMAKALKPAPSVEYAPPDGLRDCWASATLHAKVPSLLDDVNTEGERHSALCLWLMLEMKHRRN